ncbi:sugar phosphate isomerase/epimerase family protein [Bacillus sp. FSL K6-3431]|uniref:sugar phosphate isomerase/epimerase family protein n=1 Tax=Bacillus sp. FSL K6-3431 TaxID=2921500 RepID=UPI0030F6D93B
MIKLFPFKVALNTSTLFPFKLDVIQQVRIAAEAGYEGIELWMKDIDAYLAEGGTVKDLKSELSRSNIEFINAIAFFKWADADASIREKAFKQAKNEMELLASLGCKLIAAPPFGDVGIVKLEEMAGYFEQLVIIGREVGVEPILEFWGKAEKLSTLADAHHMLEVCSITNTKMLIDPFHMYVGGSDFSGLKALRGEQIGIFHINDYPEIPEREELDDSDRVFPGEGIAPSYEIAQMLHDIHYSGYLSLELFIEDYQGQGPLEVSKYGLQALKESYAVHL